MCLEDNIIYLQVTMSNYLMKRWHKTPEEFVAIDNKYKILLYIRMCYEPFHLTGDEGIAEEIESYILEQGGAI